MLNTKGHIALLVYEKLKKVQICVNDDGRKHIAESHLSGTHDLKIPIVFFKCPKTYI